MTEVVFGVPGDLATATGGYAYARKVLEKLERPGLCVRHLPLPAGVPDPTESDLAETLGLVEGLPSRAVLLIDGLAYGALPAPVIAKFARPVVALVHHPLCLELGLSSARRAELAASEAQALSLASRVIVTSPLTASILTADFGVPSGKITVAEPGTDPAPRAQGSGDPVRLLAVGAVSPRKGYDVLVAALSPLKELAWQAAIAGPTDRNSACTTALNNAIAVAGLEDRIALVGTVEGEALEALYRSADIFVSSSHFEGYGMVLAEALAHGLAIVASRGGAADETLPDQAALKVPPGDPEALADALRRAILDEGLRRRLAEAAWSAGQTLPRWSDTAAKIAGVVEEVGR